MQTVNRSRMLILAWPIILSNISTPLLGLVDTAVIGNLGNPIYLGGIAIGALIFSFLFWGFGFLRMGTTALVAQATGNGDEMEYKAAFYRAFFLAILLGITLITLKTPLSGVAFSLLDASSQVEQSAKQYFDIRIWSAPLSLANLVLLGFLLGSQKTQSVLALQLLLNGSNIVLDLVLVMYFDMGILGVAYATVAAELLACILGSYLVYQLLHLNGPSNITLHLNSLLDLHKIKHMFAINRDILIRTLCLLFSFAWFTNQSAQQGDIVLAANSVLLQFISFSAFFLDGFALVAESMVGVAVGAKNYKLFKQTIVACFQLGALTALLLSIAFYLLGRHVIAFLTNIEEVQNAANGFIVWIVISPVLSVCCYLLDGIFIGATRTSEMRNAMIISMLVFLAAWYFLSTWYGNHGLWAALQIYFVARALTLAYSYPRIARGMFATAI